MKGASLAVKRRLFRERIQKGQPILVAPGCYDGFSAKLVAYAGFEAAYMTGAGVAAALTGLPDIGLVTMTEMVETARRILEAIDLPLIADADTGYGGPLNVQRTVRQFEAAGVCAIHIEDQEIPKRCGHLAGKSVVSRTAMLNRIKAAVDARQDPNFLIIARTDARATHGLEEALERGRLCAEAGADVLFIEAPEGISEVRRIAATFPDMPLLLNRGGGGKTPPLTADELAGLGFSIVIFPGDTQKAAGRAMLDVLTVLRQQGTTAAMEDRMLGFMERFEILGLRSLQELEARFTD